MTATITAAPTCIHGHGADDTRFCHPVAIVPAATFELARRHRRDTWTEIVGCADGYSAPIPRGSYLHAQMLEAYHAAAGEAPGRLVWLRTVDYRAQRWIRNPAYLEWLARWDALETPEQRRAMRELEPAPEPPGHCEPRAGDCLCFLTLERDGALRFVG